MDAMANILQAKGPDAIDAVYCHNDEMALGAVQAIKDAGLTPGEDIQVVGIDGQKEAWELVKSGECWELYNVRLNMDQDSIRGYSKNS